MHVLKIGPGFSALMALVNGDEVGMILDSDPRQCWLWALSGSGGVFLCCTADAYWLF